MQAVYNQLHFDRGKPRTLDHKNFPRVILRIFLSLLVLHSSVHPVQQGQERMPQETLLAFRGSLAYLLDFSLLSLCRALRMRLTDLPSVVVLVTIHSLLRLASAFDHLPR